MVCPSKDGDTCMSVEDQISELHARHNRHVADYHANLPPGRAAELVQEHEDMVGDISLLVDLVAGEQIVDPFTHKSTGLRREGLADRVEKIDARTNGGGGVSIRWSDKGITALMTTLLIAAAEAIKVLL